MSLDEKPIYKKVGEIIFGVLSPKVIKKMATTKIVTPELYDREGYPVDGGLMDTRLGVIDPGLKCRTCGSKLKECTGHFGYMELARPVIHIKFVPQVYAILKGTCRECGRALLAEQKIKKWEEHLKKMETEAGLDVARDELKGALAELAAQKKCPHCNAKQGKVMLEKPHTYVEDEKKLSPIEVRARLEKVPDADLTIFGMNPRYMRPEWAIMTIFPIPPVTMRPSITLESGERSEDDLTHKLGDIVRINQRLFENINAGAPEIIIEDLWELLQYHITTFFDNSVTQLPPARHRNGQPLKTISERIKDKEGRIRYNLAGKRTNFSARTVISPDPMIDLDEVGVPYAISMKLTVPERVTSWNMDYLKKFIEKGAKKYPGANYIVRPDGKKKKITDEVKEALLEEIQLGYQIERHLLDGDVVIFNRQPSLHRMSMMCHRVKVMPGRTFRLNPAICNPYNADFDGDEMNLHVPQTEEGRTEAEVLMQVPTQLISPRYGLSVMGLIQDAVGGNYLLTTSLELSKTDAIDILAAIGVTDFSRLNLRKETFTGKEVFSAILPEDFDFIGTSKDKSKIVIKGGQLSEGAMDMANLGEGSGLLLRNLVEKYGKDRAMEIIGLMSRLGIEILLRKGFSTGIEDTDLPEIAVQEIKKTLKSAYEEVDKLIQQQITGDLEPLPGRTPEETLELRILETLNKARNQTGKIVQENAKDSGALIMIKSGARGNILNLAQMSACVGQQSLRGKRIDKGYARRTLSCFKEGDLHPDAHGFIRTGFKGGLKPHEFFFAAMTGRDSLMDTALRTPKSGYLYRRLANAMQDLRIEYDQTVRDANRKIIQFQYGEDGIDVSKSEGGIINVKRIIDEEA